MGKDEQSIIIGFTPSSYTEGYKVVVTFDVGTTPRLMTKFISLMTKCLPEYVVTEFILEYFGGERVWTFMVSKRIV